MIEQLLREIGSSDGPVTVGGQRFTRADVLALKWQYNLFGSFHTALFQAIARADLSNQARLAHGFPEEVVGYQNWTQGDLYERLQAALKTLEAENEPEQTVS